MSLGAVSLIEWPLRCWRLSADWKVVVWSRAQNAHARWLVVAAAGAWRSSPLATAPRPTPALLTWVRTASAVTSSASRPDRLAMEFSLACRSDWQALSCVRSASASAACARAAVSPRSSSCGGGGGSEGWGSRRLGQQQQAGAEPLLHLPRECACPALPLPGLCHRHGCPAPKAFPFKISGPCILSATKIGTPCTPHRARLTCSRSRFTATSASSSATCAVLMSISSSAWVASVALVLRLLCSSCSRRDRSAHCRRGRHRT